MGDRVSVRNRVRVRDRVRVMFWVRVRVRVRVPPPGKRNGDRLPGPPLGPRALPEQAAGGAHL